MYNTFTASEDMTATVKHVASVHVAENAGSPAPARVLLRNGSVSGDVVVDIRLAASDSKHIIFAEKFPMHFPNGLYVEVATGTVRGSVDGLAAIGAR